jgi:ERCC4-type nuclease
MLVMMDSNEEATNPAAVALMRKHYPNLEVTKLEFGDINILLDNGSLLSIERKKVGDFLGSIPNGHVFNQVERMSNGAKYYAIVMLGDMSFDENDMVTVDGRITEWKGASVRAAIYAIQWSGCPIVWASNSGLPFVVAELIAICEKPEIHLQLNHKRIITFPPADQRLQILASFPGIGAKKAEALLMFSRDQFAEEAKKNGDGDDKYSTIAQALMWASAFPLIASKARPEGWGDKIVQTFRLALGLGRDEYIDIKKGGL